MKVKYLLIVALVILFIAFLVFVMKNKPKTIELSLPSPSLSNDNKEQTYLIEGYPIDIVPLYKLNKVSSNKIFINTDPENISEFDETNFAYFNVVFYTEASQEEFFDYYKKLFDTLIADESENQQMVKGNIGQYKVSAAHYGSDDTAYIQVHLPNYTDEALNKYFLDYPKIVEINQALIEHEKSYGLLNQKGGEIEYTKYFTVIDSGDKNDDGKDDVDEFLMLEEEYIRQFKDKLEYSFDEKTGTMKWRDGDFESTLSISRDHGRIYIMLRKDI